MYTDSPFVLTHLEPTGLAVDRLNQSRSALDQASQLRAELSRTTNELARGQSDFSYERYRLHQTQHLRGDERVEAR
jgi:hypothetical protein